MKGHVALVFTGVMFLTCSAARTAAGQADNNGSEKPGTEASVRVGWDRPKLLKQISIYEEAVRNGEAANTHDGSLAKIYVGLASVYADLAMYPRAEWAIRRGIVLLQEGPAPKQGVLAAAIQDMAMLHVTMGELNKGEKEGREALLIRLKEGDRGAIAASYRQMATLYLKRHAFKKAVEFGQKGLDAIGDDPRVNRDEWIALRFALARALCETGSCGPAIPLLQEAIEEAKRSYGEQTLPVGMGYYQLGYMYWRNGMIVDAARWMARGIDLMRVELSWGHPAYIATLREYAKFLRQHGTEEAALVVEHEVRQADAKVDVSTMTSMQSAATLR